MFNKNKSQIVEIDNKEISDKIGDLSGLQTTNKDSLVDSVNEVTTELAERPKEQLTSIILRIPSDFSTPQEALNSLHLVAVMTNVKVTLLIESGYKLPSGNLGITREASFYIDGVDMSFVVVESEDDIVEVEDGFTGSVFRTIRTGAPTLNCLIDMKGLGDDGYSMEKGGNGEVKVGCGVINAGRIGLYSRQGSSVHAARANEDPEGSGVIFTGAGYRCLYVNHSSRAYVRGGDFSGGLNGIYCRHGSMLDAEDTDVSNSTESGLTVFNASTANVPYIKADNCGIEGIISSAKSNVNAINSSCINAGQYAVRAINAGEILVSGSDLSNSFSHAIRAENGSKIIARSCDVSDAGTSNPIAVLGGSEVIAHQTVGTANIAANQITSDGIFYQ